METTGTQSRLEGESYAQYMRRLYHHPLNRGIAAVNNPNKWDQIKDQWGFRPPPDLAFLAYKFMREKDMSVTTYLTYAMHNLHKNTNA